MTVEERLREWIADPSTNDGEFVSIRPDGVRELLAQLAKLQAVAEAATPMRRELVVRLRDWQPRGDYDLPYDLLREAADHIERAAQPGPTLVIDGECPKYEHDWPAAPVDAPRPPKPPMLLAKLVGFPSPLWFVRWRGCYRWQLGINSFTSDDLQEVDRDASDAAALALYDADTKETP